jgi:hypothetical protein
MNSTETLINISVERDIDEVIAELVDRLDFLDVQILRKFYSTGKEFPFDTQPYCFPVLYKEMKEVHRLKIGLEALRKRLDNMVRFGFLEKVSNSNPANYMPVKGKEMLVRNMIMKFFLVNGLQQFL